MSDFAENMAYGCIFCRTGNEQLLVQSLQKEYPEMWERMQKRIHFLKHELNIDLSDDLLPMCSTVGYLRPYLLNKEYALAIE